MSTQGAILVVWIILDLSFLNADARPSSGAAPFALSIHARLCAGSHPAHCQPAWAALSAGTDGVFALKTGYNGKADT